MYRIYFIIVFFFVACFHARSQTGWKQQNSHTFQSLTSVHFTDSNSGYIAGDRGTILKTKDGGLNWLSDSLETEGN
jgi:photosystem II stability/assembly factor-like uncharacterized protein